MLAEVEYVAPGPPPQPPGDLVHKIASFQMPSQMEYVTGLSTMQMGVAIILFACGLAYLLNGWKIFKTLVILNSAVMGAFLGQRFGQMLSGQNMPLFGAVAGALLFAVLSWPFMKFAVSIMGGLAGSFLGYSVWHYAASAAGNRTLAAYSWAGALIGLITLGLLAFLIFRMVIMIFTSLQGSLMTVSGLVSLLMNTEQFRGKLQGSLSTNRHLMLLLIGVPAVIGFAFQYAAMHKKTKKKGEEGS